MKEECHIVLGASGAVGTAIIHELKMKSKAIVAVGRSKKVMGVENRTADLLNLAELNKALQGATHVYLCVGLPYDIKVWRRDWPIIMGNVLNACEAEGAVLIFVDNIYMYGPTPLENPFSEGHLQNPVSKKGKVRKEISTMLLDAHKEGRIKGVIGRAADFYGPNVATSVFYYSFLERMAQGKNPQCLGALDQKHTYAYTPDLGRALVALALDESTYGEVWHLPVSEAVTINEALGFMNGVLGKDYTASRIPPFMFSILGIFMTTVKELQEMMYQFNEPYIMNSRKFLNHFPDFQVTPFEEGITIMTKSFVK